MAKNPNNPDINLLARLAANPTTRRRFLGGGGAAAAGLILGPSFLAACGSKDSGSSGGPATATSDDGSPATGSLRISNWPLYMADGFVAAFQTASGLQVDYKEDYNDNEEWFAKNKEPLSRKQDIGADLVVPTQFMALRLKRQGWLNEISETRVGNRKNLRPDLLNDTSDPGRKYTAPYMTGMVGLAYNKAATGRPITKIDDLWDPAFKGKVSLLTEMRDTVGLVALGQGVDLSKPTFSAMEKALEILEKQVADGQVRQFTGNDYMDDLTQGNFAACVGWSGDIAQLSRDNPDVRFVVPESGGTLWSDVMLIPKGAKHTSAAAKWMDFVYDPVNAARITNFVQYVSPVKGVAEELTKMGGDAAALVDNPLIFPDEATLANLNSWGNLSEDDEAKLDAAFSKIAGN